MSSKKIFNIQAKKTTDFYYHICIINSEFPIKLL